MRICLIAFLIFVGLIPTISAQAAQQANLSRFTILVPKEGMQKEFEDGYQRHLQWHTKAGDKWNWYGWYITSGKRLGYFVDASFGHTWADFDNPIDPRGDRADLTVNVIPFVNPFKLYTSAYLSEVSNSASNDLSATFQRVFYFDIRPGFENEFGEFQKSFKKVLPQVSSVQNFSWYRMEDGTEAVQYFLMMPHGKIADYKETENLFEKVFEKAPKSRKIFQTSVSNLRAETMRYRADLTYLPKDKD